MLTFNEKLTLIASIGTFATICRDNSNSLEEISYKASCAGYHIVDGPIWPNARKAVYSVGNFLLFPAWDHRPERNRGSYIVCDQNGLELTITELYRISDLLKE